MGEGQDSKERNKYRKVEMIEMEKVVFKEVGYQVFFFLGMKVRKIGLYMIFFLYLSDFLD